MNHPQHRHSPSSKAARFNFSTKPQHVAYAPSIQSSKRKSPAPQPLPSCAPSPAESEDLPPNDIYFSNKRLPSNLATANQRNTLHSLPRSGSSKKLVRGPKHAQDKPPGRAGGVAAGDQKPISTSHSFVTQQRMPHILLVRSDKRLESARSEAKELQTEVWKLKGEVELLKAERANLIGLCHSIRKQQEQDRERIREYENQLAVQAVNYRTRIRNLQYQLREHSAEGQRIYHMANYKPVNYEQHVPVLDSRRIEEVAEKYEQSTLKGSKLDLLTEEPKAWPDGLSAIQKKDDSTISELSLESQKHR